MFCIHAYLEYNVSMNVNRKTNPVPVLQNLLARQNGMLLTSDLAKWRIPRIYLSVLEKNGEIRRVSRGIYAAADSLTDEMASLQARYKAGIFSHETALYLWELTDRSPLFFSMTVPSGYNATALKASGAKVYFIHRDLHALGQITTKSLHANAIQTYDLERTLCDVLRSRNQIDIQFVTTALKRYVQRKDKNLDRLFDYAGHFRIQKIVREYMEVLL
jgi:predicted transcriptional regulator of viral defense system